MDSSKSSEKRVLSPGRKFVCTTPGCSKSFTRRDYLSRHEANHSDIKPFPCIQCDLGFARKDLLEKHYKSQSHQRKREELTSKTKGLIVNNLTPQMVQKKQKIENRDVSHMFEREGIHNTIRKNNNGLESENNNIIVQPVTSSNLSSMQTNFNSHSLDPPLQAFPMHYPPIDSYLNYSTGLTDNFGWLFGDIIDPTANLSDVDRFSINHSNSPQKTSPAVSTCKSTSEYDDPSPPSSSNSLINNETYSKILITLNINHLSEYSVLQMSEFLVLYWNKFSLIYPIIHFSTFDANKVDILLLISMISIGMGYSDQRGDYLCSVEIHRRLRHLLFGQIGDENVKISEDGDLQNDGVKVELELLQCILLDNFYCKLFGDSAQFQVAQLFHGTAISLLRFSGYLDELVEPVLKHPTSVDETEQMTLWRDWINYETCKRTAFFGFIIDSQHASLFRHNQLMSAFEIQLELPCTDAVWNAHSYSRFFKEYERQPKELRSRAKPNWDVSSTVTDNNTDHNGGLNSSAQKHTNGTHVYTGPSMPNIKIEGNWPCFLWSLRRLMQPYKEHQKEYPMNCFSQFSRFIFLHGLLSIGWDLRWRSLLDLGIVSKKRLVDLSDRIQKSFFNWRGYFDMQITHTNNASLEVKNDLLDKDFEVAILNDYGASPMFWANLTLFQMANITLHVDIVSIVKLASDFTFNSPSASINHPAHGNNHSSHIPTKIKYKNIEKTRNREKMQAWTRSSDGTFAVIESCQFLNTVINNEDIIDCVPHVPWTIFIACLTIWCYETNSEVSSKTTDQKLREPISSSRYLMDNSMNANLAREDCLKYISKILEKDSTTTQLNKEEIGDKDYWKTQQRVIGIVSFTRFLLSQCKWANINSLIAKLDKLLSEYR